MVLHEHLDFQILQIYVSSSLVNLMHGISSVLELLLITGNLKKWFVI